MNTEKLNFIVVDDSKLDCFIAEKIVKNTPKMASANIFQQAQIALDHISSIDENEYLTVVFVDIQMPVMSGFDFVEEFEKFPEDKKSKYDIYMLSSSINESDLARVKGYNSIKKFLNKPLTNDIINSVLLQY